MKHREMIREALLMWVVAGALFGVAMLFAWATH